MATHKSAQSRPAQKIMDALRSFTTHRSVTVMKPLLVVALAATTLLSSCTVVRQGEVGVRRKLGKIDQDVILAGPKVFNPFVTTVLKVPTTTQNLEIRSNLPSKEGLTVGSEISILYRVQGKQVPAMLETVGMQYADVLILPVFRSAAADVGARYFAKDMHSSERAAIEKAIRDQMATVLEPRGFVIENVLLKNIVLPGGLAKAIEDKLEAEQDAQRMEFLKQRETRDAERRVIEAEGQKRIAVVKAEGEREANIIQAKGQAEAMRIEAEAVRLTNQLINRDLTPAVLKYKSIEAFRELSKSQNAKTIISNGTTPVLNTLAQ
ncbi:prohibitin family protein [Hymenobacter weizhouensis]|uniref:prohibitin family protein n=1 Tax=Hymenobacter sp. YIM 151500-1 TaxID=2987689 RepID=UPI0022264B4F|nr:SPFH domain-containing protein [Hymenobacter sp. YIM 151500-1]UYZ62774.1 SPFH domain-containing protein [Hymenobacter sp. YIM 151500-1]